MVSILFLSLTAFCAESMLVADIRCIPFSTQLFKLKTKMGIYIFTIIGNPSHVSLMIPIVEKMGLSEKIPYLSWLEIYTPKSTKLRTRNRIHTDTILEFHQHNLLYHEKKYKKFFFLYSQMTRPVEHCLIKDLFPKAVKIQNKWSLLWTIWNSSSLSLFLWLTW